MISCTSNTQCISGKLVYFSSEGIFLENPTHSDIALQFLEDDINGHQEMFASLNENGQQIMAEMEPGDVLTAVQAKLDDMNDRCQPIVSLAIIRYQIIYFTVIVVEFITPYFYFMLSSLMLFY